jgi:hypothetical protein
MTDWFFVRHLVPGESQRTRLPFEVQLLDAEGRATDVAHFDAHVQTIIINGIAIPAPVVARALTYPAGFGDYVDALGRPTDMQRQPTQSAVPITADDRANELLATARRLLTMASPYPRGARLRLELVVAEYGGCAAAIEAADLLRSISDSA